MKKSFLITNVRLTENNNTTLSLKVDGRVFTFGGISTSSATGGGAWISLTGDHRSQFAEGQIINDVPDTATIADNGELIIH